MDFLLLMLLVMLSLLLSLHIRVQVCASANVMLDCTEVCIIMLKEVNGNSHRLI